MRFDEDNIRQGLRGGLERMDVPRDIPPTTLRRARTRRMRWISMIAGLTVVVAIAGLAGAGTLLSQDDQIDPAPDPERSSTACSGDPTIEVVGGPHRPGKRARFVGECWPDGPQEPAGRDMFLTAIVGPDGVPVSKKQSPRTTNTCRFVAEVENQSVVTGDGELRGWFVVPTNANCKTKSSLRTHMPIRTGTYKVGIGCAAAATPVECSSATVRIRQNEGASNSSEVVYYGLRRNIADCGVYDRSYVARPVDVPEGEGSVLTSALRALFTEEWDVPPSRVEKVEILEGRAIIYLSSMDGLEGAGASCGSIGFLGSLLRTAFQFDSIESVEIRLGGSCKAFGDFMQSARCEVFTRDTLTDRRG